MITLERKNPRSVTVIASKNAIVFIAKSKDHLVRLSKEGRSGIVEMSDIDGMVSAVIHNDSTEPGQITIYVPEDKDTFFDLTAEDSSVINTEISIHNVNVSSSGTSRISLQCVKGTMNVVCSNQSHVSVLSDYGDSIGGNVTLTDDSILLTRTNWINGKLSLTCNAEMFVKSLSSGVIIDDEQRNRVIESDVYLNKVKKLSDM